MSQRFNFCITVAYDGTPFLGWQDTKEGPSVQGELLKAFKIVLREEVEINGASRTDAGVHSHGQIASFYASKKPDFYTFLKSVNSLLPHEIKVTSILEKPAEFHATLHNTGKEYHYWLTYSPVQFPHTRRTMWHTPGLLNVEKMKQAASSLIGTRDFQALCNVKKNEEYESTIRTLSEITIIEHPHETLQVVIKGNNFLYKMVRNIVGTLVYVGKERISVGDISLLLDQKDRTQLGPTAPAHGLTLFRVFGNSIEQIDHSKPQE